MTTIDITEAAKLAGYTNRKSMYKTMERHGENFECCKDENGRWQIDKASFLNFLAKWDRSPRRSESVTMFPHSKRRRPLTPQEWHHRRQLAAVGMAHRRSQIAKHRSEQ